MSSLLIRRATADDVETLSALIARTVIVSNTPDYEADAIRMLQEFARPASVAERMAGRDCFVAVDGDKVVGTISLGGDRLRQTYVAPEYQKHGLGRRLVEHLEAHARSLGVMELRLHSSLTARAFYARLGYEAVEYQPHDVPTWLMTKRLDGAS